MDLPLHPKLWQEDDYQRKGPDISNEIRNCDVLAILRHMILFEDNDHLSFRSYGHMYMMHMHMYVHPSSHATVLMHGRT